jgi:hypothetical protein
MSTSLGRNPYLYEGDPRFQMSSHCGRRGKGEVGRFRIVGSVVLMCIGELLSITFFNCVPTDVRMQGDATCFGPTPP